MLNTLTISAEGKDSCNECPGNDIKLSDGEVPALELREMCSTPFIAIAHTSNMTHNATLTSKVHPPCIWWSFLFTQLWIRPPCFTSTILHPMISVVICLSGSQNTLHSQKLLFCDKPGQENWEVMEVWEKNLTVCFP